ncbi:c-type cytochrome [Zoogloea sp. LCSB751]|uniref:c-type cytochrome n=1 Tax=Zoogloea sp. LCSB751 TaxID=1965277 RepID=UPI0009A4A849|nr:c-type cytochrome [Zoogloea sp. LCSB751]
MRAPFLAVMFAVALASLPAVAGAEPQRDFQTHCSGCHQMDGSGAPKFGIPDMRHAVGHFLRLPEGRHFLVKVPGTANSPLGHADTAAMLNWMVFAFSRDEVPADFRPYTAQEVARLRGQTFHDVPGARAEIVRRLRADGLDIQ